MEQAVTYVEQLNELIFDLVAVFRNKNVRLIKGRKYDRIALNDVVTYFVDKDTKAIYGAKSAVQHNLRRQYGTLDTVKDMDWENNRPKANTTLLTEWEAREQQIVAGYKRRGRPRKVTP